MASGMFPWLRDQASSQLFHPLWTILLEQTAFQQIANPEIFQHWLEVASENLPGINIIADDTLIHREGDTIMKAERNYGWSQLMDMAEPLCALTRKEVHTCQLSCSHLWNIIPFRHPVHGRKILWISRFFDWSICAWLRYLCIIEVLLSCAPSKRNVISPVFGSLISTLATPYCMIVLLHTTVHGPGRDLGPCILVFTVWLSIDFF